MNRIHTNSIDTYWEIQKTLPRSRSTVLSTIKTKGKITRQGIADTLGWPINQVTGRVRELLDAGIIIEDEHDSSTGRKRAFLKYNEERQ